MKLDRNITTPRRGKYALIKMRVPNAAVLVFERDVRPPKAIGYFVKEEAMDFGDTEDSDFFVIRLKDKFAAPALLAYAQAITEHLATLPHDDPTRKELTEYHHDIIDLAQQAVKRENRRIPD